MANQIMIGDDRILAARVRAEIERIGMSQAALAREMDVSEHYLSRRVRGEVPFSAVELARIAGYLNVSTDELLGRAA